MSFFLPTSLPPNDGLPCSLCIRFSFEKRPAGSSSAVMQSERNGSSVVCLHVVNVLGTCSKTVDDVCLRVGGGHTWLRWSTVPQGKWTIFLLGRAIDRIKNVDAESLKYCNGSCVQAPAGAITQYTEQYLLSNQQPVSTSQERFIGWPLLKYFLALCTSLAPAGRIPRTNDNWTEDTQLLFQSTHLPFAFSKLYALNKIQPGGSALRFKNCT